MLNLTSDVCVPCPLNFYQNQPGKHYCFPCPPSQGTNNNGSAQSGDCIEFCPPGTQLNSSNECEPCPRGSYRVGSQQDQCTRCPANFTTVDVGHDSEADCKIPFCTPGTFANTTNGINYTCTPCKIGSYQPGNASVACISCRQNFTTNITGATSNDQCYFYCEAGYEENPPNSEMCTPCVRGSYRPNDDDNRFKNCSQCPPDLTTESDKSVSLSDCKLKRCGPGHYLSDDLSKCQPCPYDQFQPDDLPTSTTQCTACSQDTGTVNVASNSSSDCKHFCSAGHGITGSNCTECLQGFWNNGNTSMRFEPCHKCPENYTTVGIGAMDIKNCSLRACPAGTKIVNEVDCEDCIVGTYQPLPYQTFCNVCRENTSTSSVGSTSPEDCTISCPAGTEGNLTDHCEVCGDDEYKNVSGFGKCYNCTGDYTSSISNRTHCTEVHCDFGREYKNNACKDCLVGFYKSIRGNNDCMKCPANKTTPLPASISIDNCNITSCDPGFFSNDNTICLACPIGTYKNNSGNQPCSDCPQGVTTVNAGSTHADNCSRILCSAGFYRFNDSYCISCPIGEYQNETNQTECKKCPSLSNRPSTTFNTTSTDIRDCYPICQAGYFLNRTERSCLPCPYGTYKNTTDLSETCNECPANLTTGSIAANNSNDCRFSICSKGHYRPSSLYVSCIKCPVGTYKNVSSVQQADCFQCPDNKTTLVEGATSQEKYCITNCPEGQQFSLTENNCSACPVGQYREDSTVLNVCKYCPTNQTTLSPGATTCIQSSAPTPSDVKINITVYVNISIASCGNLVHLEAVIKDITIHVIINARRDNYPGLCPTEACSNLNYSLLDICGRRGKKRQVSGLAHVKIVLYDISSSLTSSGGARRNTVNAVLELFMFGQLPFEDIMDMNGLAIIFDKIEVMCPRGDFYSTTQNMCSPCSAGQYVTSSQICEACPKGTYADSPDFFCKMCPDGQTTDKVGSQSQSDCKGLCYFDDSYCGSDGKCLVISNVHQCKCNDNYIGQQCAQRQNLENSNTVEIVAGVCSALGAILLIVGIVFGICTYKNNLRRSKRSTSSDSEVFSQGVPHFQQPIMFENPAMVYDPTMYSAEAMDFYSPEASLNGINKSSKISNERWAWIEN
ncbi:hypothetical protein Btru_004887 [Bulinus truncatus]|nr:hypothetical protein Btru_004887 [Bulinus truncatus]